MMMPVSTADLGCGLMAHGEPDLSQMAHLKTVWHFGTGHLIRYPAWIDDIACGSASNIGPGFKVS
jgi:hypothetical protein